MDKILFFIFGVLIGSILVWLAKDRRGKDNQELDAYNQQRKKDKEEAKRKILEFLNTRESINNNDVENLIGVSDATATNYLQELEDERRIKQIGKEGRFVRYILSSNG